MATEKAKEAIAAAPQFKIGDLQPAPDYIQKDDRRGLENMNRDDILMPRLALAQALSPQVTEGDPKRIEGLKAGDLFNSLKGTRYGGREPVYFQVIRKDKPRAMEFRPVDEGGGVIDPNVPMGDPRLAWGEAGEKPVATLFRDYLVLLLPQREIIALSFKSTGIKVAKALNGLIAMRGSRPIFAGVYALWTGIEQRPKPHQVYLVDNAGWASQADLAYGEQMYEALKDFDIAAHVDRDDTSFDVEEMERGQTQTANPGM